MKFRAEVKKVEAKKQSLDMVYEIRLVTDDSKVMALGMLPADTIFNVEIIDE